MQLIRYTPSPLNTNDLPSTSHTTSMNDENIVSYHDNNDRPIQIVVWLCLYQIQSTPIVQV